MELFFKIVNGFQPLAIFAKSFVLDVWLGSEYASEVSGQYRPQEVKVWSEFIMQALFYCIECAHSQQERQLTAFIVTVEHAFARWDSDPKPF